tara:strand:+ start:428 stop:1018 length:591 start_codon:yes stop_codon:yes gene_type:complete
MSLTTVILNNRILNIQVKQAALGIKLVDALQADYKTLICLNRKNVSATNLLQLLYSYIPFTSEVFFASKIDFVSLSTGTGDLDLTLNGDTYTQTGADIEDIDAIIDSYVASINAVTTPQYAAFKVGSTMYVYSYDNTATFGDTFTFTSSTTNFTGTITNLSSDYSEILDIWNSVSSEEICQIINLATYLSDVTKKC